MKTKGFYFLWKDQETKVLDDNTKKAQHSVMYRIDIFICFDLKKSNMMAVPALTTTMPRFAGT